MPTYTGTVVDKETGTPLPGATVTIRRVADQLTAGAANGSGKFSLSADKPASHIVISNVDYQTTMFPAYESFTYEVARDFENNPEVIVHATIKKNNTWLWLLGGLAILAAANKKKTNAGNYRR